jgi:hypothetical protein
VVVLGDMSMKVLTRVEEYKSSGLVGLLGNILFFLVSYCPRSETARSAFRLMGFEKLLLMRSTTGEKKSYETSLNTEMCVYGFERAPSRYDRSGKAKRGGCRNPNVSFVVSCPCLGVDV